MMSFVIASMVSLFILYVLISDISQLLVCFFLSSQFYYVFVIIGTDEPGTNACHIGSFFCPNKGFKQSTLPSSRVNDGKIAE